MGIFMPGCVPWSRGLGTIDEKVTDWRDFIWGKRAFSQRHGHGQSGPFRDGFLEGYHDMLQGADGCLPVVPPRRYWSWKYQSAGGQGAVSDWFNGYSAGVTAAKEDGLANISRVPASVQFNGNSTVPIQRMPNSSEGNRIPFEESIAPTAIPIPPAAESGDPPTQGAFYFEGNKSRAGVIRAAAKSSNRSSQKPAGSGVIEIVPITKSKAEAAIQPNVSPKRSLESTGKQFPSELPPIIKANGPRPTLSVKR
jgi:hypothetical protein